MLHSMAGRGAHANPVDLAREGLVLGRLGVEVQSKATPKPGAGVTLLISIDV